MSKCSLYKISEVYIRKVQKRLDEVPFNGYLIPIIFKSHPGNQD